MNEQIHTRMLSETAPPLVLGLRVDPLEFDDAVAAIGQRIAEVKLLAAPATPAAMVCAANVHMVMEAWDAPDYRALVNRADLVLADGQPLVWALRLLGVPQQHRVRVSPDLLLRLFGEAERLGWSVGLYGGSDETLPVFIGFLAQRYPNLRMPFAYAPPFRPLSLAEDEEVVARLRSAGVQLLLVGLGCPKQERWMAEHREHLSCLMIGVGAAFDLFGGRTTEAPRWTRDIGLEWAYRLAQEPRRLWRRHAKHDPRFIMLLALQVARRCLNGRPSPHR